MHAKMWSTRRPVDKISEYLLFIVTDGGHFGCYALKQFANFFWRGVGAYYFTKTLSYLNNRQTLLAEG